MAKNKKKVTTAIVAGVTAVALLLGGTFAWQSINQTALNEASDVINPGGRLHDDFDGKNKDVYVENFAEDPIFARVRLDEYFEIIMNKGAGNAEKVEVITTGAERDKLDTYITHIFGDDNATDAFWTWQTGGQTVYMPTFNKDKDSLKADINGTYAGLDGDPDTENDAYGDYVPAPSVSETKEDNAKYDADTDNLDNGGTTDVLETHTAKETLGATLISMDEWFNDYDAEPGPYWVYDEDGWVYWAAPIAPGTATGLLLDEIKLNEVMDDSWYYAINVVAQFVTADDLGRGSGTGFYDTKAGKAPSEKALELLEKIGVDTTSVVEDESALRDALLAGGNVQINGTIDSTKNETGGLNFSYDYLWHDGGVLSGGTMNLNTGSNRGLFINNEKNWPVDGDGANEATLKDITINSNSVTAVYVQAIDAPVNLQNVKITADNAGIYINMGDEVVTLDNVTIDASNNDTVEGKDYFNSAVAIAAPGNVVINSGSYTGDHAVYIFNTSGTVEINGGYFDGALKVDAGTLTITGGTFTVDPSEFVDLSTYEVITNDDETYTVKAIGGNNGGETSTFEVTVTDNATGTRYTTVNGNLQLSPSQMSSYVLSVANDAYSAADYNWVIAENYAPFDSELSDNGDGTFYLHTSFDEHDGCYVVVTVTEKATDNVVATIKLILDEDDEYEDPTPDSADDTTGEDSQITLTYSVVEPADWDGTISKGQSITLKIDGDYTADDLTWDHASQLHGAGCVSQITENEDGSATLTGGLCGGGGDTIRVSLTSDPSVYLDIEIGCGD